MYKKNIQLKSKTLTGKCFALSKNTRSTAEYIVDLELMERMSSNC